MTSLRFLLLQVRNDDDPMRDQEVGCFAKSLGCPVSQIETWDLLDRAPPADVLAEYHAVLLGGSGDYSVVTGGDWLDEALRAMRFLYDHAKPTFASCWGFQAMARAMGGKVVTDLSRAEVGTVAVDLTPAGRDDPVFGGLPSSFVVHMGHQDIVDEIPPDAVSLAGNDRVSHQAFCFPGRPIYCTQFHPELERETFLERLVSYPQYIRRIAGISMEEFIPQCRETPEANTLLPRFLAECVRA